MQQLLSQDRNTEELGQLSGQLVEEAAGAGTLVLLILLRYTKIQSVQFEGILTNTSENVSDTRTRYQK